MDTEFRKTCEDQLAILRGLVKQRTITPDMYYKGVVGIACEYVSQDEVEEGVQLLLTVPVAYYRDTQPKQMVSDPTYQEVVMRFARKLVLFGKVDADTALTLTPVKVMA